MSISKDKRRELASRMTAAFEDLRKQGIFARQNFMCCMGCASSNIGEMAKKANAKNPGRYIGAAYYHQQDSDDFKEQGRCHIGYGYVPGGPLSGLPDDLATLTIGNAVRSTMERHGFSVEWDGSPNKRILVKGH
jgi:hypothetical protein